MNFDIHNIPSVDSDSHGILSLSPAGTLQDPSPHYGKDNCASETEAETPGCLAAVHHTLVDLGLDRVDLGQSIKFITS